MYRKKVYIALGVILVVFILSLIVLQLRATILVENFLDKKIPSHVVLDYGAMQVNILSGTINLEGIKVVLRNRDTTLAHSTFTAKGLSLEGFSYSQFFFNSTIKADEIMINSPVMEYYPSRRIPKKDSLSQGVVKLLKTILVEKLAIRKGEFLVRKEAKDSIQVQVKDINFDVADAKTGPKIVKDKIPVSYTDYSFSTGTIFVDLGQYEMLDVGKFDIEKNSISIKDLVLQSKYDKRELSRKLDMERDYISLKVPEIIIKDMEFGFHINRFYVEAGLSEIQNPNLDMYRDKLLPDDKSHKKMYSQILRDLPIDIDVPEIKITRGHVEYEENVDPKAKAGRLFFDELDATITGVDNFGKDGKPIKIKAHARMMGSAPLELSWSFDAMNKDDAFIASGSLKGFNTQNANSFLRPTLRVEAEGFVDQLYFTISGNAVNSIGDMKMKYHDFKFEVLDRDRLNVNKLLSAIGNLFVNDGSKTDAQGFRYGKIEAERQMDKSFFNYLWINVRNGIVKTLTGDGEKER